MTLTHPLTVPPPTGTQRLLAAPGPGLDTHHRTHGTLPHVGPGIIDEIGLAGVDGRGGAGFPLARKLDAVAGRTRRGSRGAPIVIANGAEGEPASRKDAVLLGRAPHLVLDGIVVAALAIGATEAVVATSERLADRVRQALAERTDARSGTDPVTIAVRALPHSTFVAGQATALASAVAGGRGLPEDRTVRLAERGPGGRPTLVSNVETLAQAALVARYGAAWARSVGSASAPGTRLVTVSDVTDPPGAVVLETAGVRRSGSCWAPPGSRRPIRDGREPCWSAGGAAPGCRPRRSTRPSTSTDWHRGVRRPGPACWPCSTTGPARSGSPRDSPRRSPERPPGAAGRA